jgi:VWFA-related protein
MRISGNGFRTLALGWVFATLFSAPLLAQGDEEPPAPLDLDLQEYVDVKLVLIDAIVLNGKDETVDGLTAEDFELLVDHKQVEIATFDVDCPLGGRPDAPVGATRPESLAGAFESPRRYIFVVDYFHLATSAVEVLENVQDAVERLHVPGEQYMLISLGQALRIEVPFTGDPQEIVRGIDRMIIDRGLYDGFYERLTERRWYRRILMLLDLMELIPGHKSIVLFSGPFLPDGWDYDETFQDIAAMAARSRTAFYPVDSRGLTLASVMGPRQLSRLAVETGGRATGGTNDLARGFARAQRDQGCRYTLGFYDNAPRPDQERKVRLFVRRGGHHVVHPTFYVVRSTERKRRSLVRSAAMVPSMFATDRLTADLFLVRPRSESRWETLAAIGIDPEILQSAPAGTPWVLKGALRKLHGTVHRNLKFEQHLTTPEDPGAGPPENLTLFQKLQPPAGRYTLDVVLSSPASDSPLATTREVVIPEIPRNELFMVGPLLGKETGGEAVNGEETSGGVDVALAVKPLLEREAVQGEPLASLTTVCFVGREEQPEGQLIRRVLQTEEGRAVSTFDPVTVALAGEGRVKCHSLLDPVSTANLEPGDYLVRAFARNAVNPRDGGDVAFSVLPAAVSD